MAQMVPEKTFHNPLHPMVLGDPFVLKFNGLYYAYGTPDSGGIPVLRSPDLANWEPAGEVTGPAPEHECHWAPEVAYQNGRFFLYYSTGGSEGEGHQLRVAVSGTPTGPFEESHELLDPDDPFTIDAHPFRDNDGQWYLFYCRDFFDGPRVGTGIVVDRLVNMSRLAGKWATVLRPHAEWQIFERDRCWYDGVWDWFTVEGPFVRKHEGRYWCFYSGGAWRAENYGVGCAVADRPLGPYEPVGAADGASVLRTLPGRVIGPGHACVVVGPDNISEYLVYHAWDPHLRGRRMFADRLMWVGGEPASPGPRLDPQPYPPEPPFRELFGCEDGRGPDPARWRTNGRWEVREGAAVHAGHGWGSMIAVLSPPLSYLLEVNLAFAGGASSGAVCGALTSYIDDDTYSAVLVDPAGRRVISRCMFNGAAGDTVLGELSRDFEAAAYHRLLVQRGAGRTEVTLDGVTLKPAPDLLPPGAVGLWSNTFSRFAGVAVSDLIH